MLNLLVSVLFPITKTALLNFVQSEECQIFRASNNCHSVITDRNGTMTVVACCKNSVQYVPPDGFFGIQIAQNSIPQNSSPVNCCLSSCSMTLRDNVPTDTAMRWHPLTLHFISPTHRQFILSTVWSNGLTHILIYYTYIHAYIRVFCIAHYKFDSVTMRFGRQTSKF